MWPAANKGVVVKNGRFKVCIFFAGVGGIDLGFETAGFKTIYANEYDPAPCKTLKQIFQLK